MADRTHGGNHAPLLNGGWLKPGFCAGCDAERAGEALGAIVHVTHVAADSEEYARIFNEGYEAAMAQHLADDPSAADDWLAAHTAAAEARGAERALTEIGERARAAQDEVQGADFGTVLVATVNAYSDACKDLLARVEGGA